jgi:alpha-L-arabinofuranosidase
VDYYAAMKRVDPSIDVLATWAPISSGKLKGGKSFPQLMAEHGRADDYDGLTIHPYTNFARDLKVKGFPSELVGHHYQMLGEAATAKMVTDLQAEVRKYAKKKDAYVAVTECGALWFGEHDTTVYPEYNNAMTHTLYMASQWARFANIGLPWAVSNGLMSEKPGVSRSVLGSAPDFVYTPDAVVREQLRDIVQGGGHVVENRVRDNVEVKAVDTRLGSSCKALVTTASIDREGALNVLVVNRSPRDSVKGRVVLDGFSTSGKVAVSVVSGESFDRSNTADHPDDVRIRTSRTTLKDDSLTWTFEAHAVTLLRFACR